ncbi:hypothetical protein DB346_20755 [Verrucomicrobia bacterium LW23]|nr:hypothetical protein DB346_20755 [Verrucomicrobia bacterium LW23]
MSSSIARPPLACSTSWNCAAHSDGSSIIRQIRALGFASAEISSGVRPECWPGIEHAAAHGATRIVAIHRHQPPRSLLGTPLPQLTDASPALRARAAADYRDCIRRAAALAFPGQPAPIVILALGYGSRRVVTPQLEAWYRRGELLSRRYVAAKIEATRDRKAAYPALWQRVKEMLDPIVDLAGELRVRLALETGAMFENFPHEDEMDAVLDAYPATVLGYWHDFGSAARKEFLGWHTHEETLRRRRDRLIGCHVHDCRAPSEDHLPLGHGEINFSLLVPMLPPQCLPVLEPGAGATEEQLIASRNRWSALCNSYANT